MVLNTIHNLIKFCLLCGAMALALISVLGETGRVFLVLDTLNHFRPLTMIAGIGLLAAIMVTYRRPLRRQPAFWLVILTLAIQGSSLGPEIARSIMMKAAASTHPSPRENRLRIATLNVWGGNDKQIQTADALLALDPDVIVLQEVWKKQKPLIAHLRQSHPHASECVGVSRCNVAILSRYPLRYKKVFRPDFHGATGWTVPVVRADLIITKADGTFETSIFATHLTWPNQVPLQNTQMRQVAIAVSHADRANVVLIGDFNSTPWSYGLAHLDDLLHLQRVTLALPTWPSSLVPRVQRLIQKSLADYGLKPSPLYGPYLPIDHAFIGEALSAKSVKRVQIPGSDHYAVILDVAPKSNPAGL